MGTEMGTGTRLAQPPSTQGQQPEGCEAAVPGRDFKVALLCFDIFLNICKATRFTLGIKLLRNQRIGGKPPLSFACSKSFV